MFTTRQYRAKAAEYGKLVKLANGADERHEFQALERSFTELADNAQWLADNLHKTVRRPGRGAGYVELDAPLTAAARAGQ
jgi:hypothetical protein